MKRLLFYDMDGVLADFDKSFVDTFKIDHRGMPKEEMWKHIHGHDEFFFNLPLMPAAEQLFYAGMEYKQAGEIEDVMVLTSAGCWHYEHVAQQKRRWIKKHFGDIMVLPTVEGLHKASFIQNPGDILIDDWRKNTQAWELAGGTAIKYESPYQSMQELHEILQAVEA